VRHSKTTGSLQRARFADLHRPALSIERYRQFKAFEKRILVATDIFGRGIDIERVNIVVNYDQSGDADSYLHRVGRAGRFGTRGLAITFITSEADQEILTAIQSRFEVKVEALPEVIEPSTYSAFAVAPFSEMDDPLTHPASLSPFVRAFLVTS